MLSAISKMAALRCLSQYKVASKTIDEFEQVLSGFGDTPDKYKPNLLSGAPRRHRINGKTYRGKTPTTNLEPKSYFQHVFDLHDSRSNTSALDLVSARRAF